MSANSIYDIVVDEIIKTLESDVDLPPEFEVRLDPEQFAQLLESGMKNAKTGEDIALTANDVWIQVGDVKVRICPEIENILPPLAS